MFKGKICISRIDKIGDMILTLPVIKSVKIQNPGSEIHVLASTYNVKVLKDIKYVDKVLSIGSNSRSSIKEIRQLRKIKYDFFINFLRFLKGQYENIIIIMYHSIVIDVGEQCRSFHRC